MTDAARSFTWPSDILADGLCPASTVITAITFTGHVANYTIPTKFIAPDGQTCWLAYSGNWSAKDHPGNPLGSHYARSLHEISLSVRDNGA